MTKSFLCWNCASPREEFGGWTHLASNKTIPNFSHRDDTDSMDAPIAIFHKLNKCFPDTIHYPCELSNVAPLFQNCNPTTLLSGSPSLVTQIASHKVN